MRFFNPVRNPSSLPRQRRGRRLGAALGILAVLAAGTYALTQDIPGQSSPRTAGVRAFYINDLNIAVTGGDKGVVLDYTTSQLRRNNGSISSGTRMVITVTKPDASTSTFRQTTDADGRIRGQVYGSELDQVGVYAIKVKVDGAAIEDTANFLIEERAKLAADNQTFTGNNQVFRNDTNSATAFSVQNAAGTEILGIDTTGGGTVRADTVQANGASELTLTGGNGGVAVDIDANGTGTDAFSVNSGFENDLLSIGSAEGNAVFQNSTDSVNAFRVNDDDGTERFRIDTTDGSGALIDISGALNLDTSTNANFTIDNDDSASNQFAVHSGDGVGGGGLNIFNLSSNTGRAYFKNFTDTTTAFRVQKADGVTNVLTVDTQNNELELNSAGKLVIGTGALYNSAADILETDDGFDAEYIAVNDSPTTAWLNVRVDAGDSSPALRTYDGSNARVFDVSNTGVLSWGSSGDTNLYRDAAGNMLKTDDAFVAAVGSTNPGSFDRLTNDGTIISLRQDGIEEGTISVSGTTVSYNAFTGSHYADAQEEIDEGMLVTLTGRNGRLGDRQDSELLYGVKKTTRANDPEVMGVYLSVLNPKTKDNKDRAESSVNPSLVTAVGNGEVWVADTGKDLKPGDNLTSSDVAGHAMSDPEHDAVSHVVAKVAEPVDWDEVEDTVERDGKEVKRKKVSVFFTAFDKVNNDALQKADQRTDERLEELEMRIGQLGEGSASPMTTDVPGSTIGTGTAGGVGTDLRQRIDDLRDEAIASDKGRDTRNDRRFERLEKDLAEVAALIRSRQIVGDRKTGAGGSFLGQLGLYARNGSDTDISGTVDGAAGETLRGEGFSAKRIAEGTYRIAFEAALPDVPSPVVTPLDPEDVVVCSVHRVTAQGFVVKCRDFRGAYVDQDFTVQVSGIRVSDFQAG